MLHAEYVTGNPFTGRQVWIIRHIRGTWGDRFDWCCNIIKPYYFSRTVTIEAMIGSGVTRQQIRHLTQFVFYEMGFSHAKAQRNGRWVNYHKMKSYRHTNGFIRDVMKMWGELLVVCEDTKPHIKRVFTDFDGHAVQNVFVETLRASPYFWGHVWAIWLVYKLIIWGVGYANSIS